MKQILLLLVILAVLTACAPKTITLDDARQIAVNSVMSDDNYTQNDGYDFKELEANTLDCEACYAFKYEYKIDSQYVPGVDGYTVDVVMKGREVTSVIFNEINSESGFLSINSNNSLPPITDRFDKFCDNKCGDGYCDEIVCQDIDCTCEESPQNCPEDC